MEIYNKLKVLGKGAFGTVYLCERKHNQLKVVVKKISGDLDANQLQEAQNEVRILKSLNHPGIIQYFDSFMKNDMYYIAMEYARCGTLYDLIASRKPINFLPKERVLSIFCQILMAVDHIHKKKIIHRDLKCENIFLTGFDGEIVKIGDFGISKALNSANNKATTVIGTTNYIAPEICDGRPYDTKSDIWSLGCILYEICSLQRLFDGSIANIVLSIKMGKRKYVNMAIYGPEMQCLIDSMVHIDPKYRPTATSILASTFIFPIRYSIVFDLGNIGLNC